VREARECCTSVGLHIEVQRCEMHGVDAAVQRSERKNLSVTEGASASGVFLA